MSALTVQVPSLPAFNRALSFGRVRWSEYAGEAGAYVTPSLCGQFEAIAEQGNCFYCGCPPSNTSRSQHGTGDFTYNGLDKIDSRKGYTVNNVVPCCRVCNFAKTNRSQGEFIAWVKRVYNHLSQTAIKQQWINP